MERIGANHEPGNLPGDSNQWHAIEKSVGEATDQVGGSGSGGGDAHAGNAGGARVALGGEDSALLVAREDVPDDVRTREGLVDLQGGAARVSKHVGDALSLQGFDEDVGAFSGFVGGKPGSERLGFRNDGGRRGDRRARSRRGLGEGGAGYVERRGADSMFLGNWRKGEGETGNGRG